MEPWVSYVPWRTSEWKGHNSIRAVRRAIAYDKGHNVLRLFEMTDDGMGAEFTEIHRDDWERKFGK
jgi:hypothetical protein